MFLMSKGPLETNEEFFIRLCANKDTYDITWTDIANIMNDLNNSAYSSDKYRKEYSSKYRDELDSINSVESIDDSEAALALLHEIQKERFKLKDERNQINNDLRRISREESCIEIAKEVAESISAKKSLDPFIVDDSNSSNKTGILLISDWHYGIDVDSSWNKYNPDICKSRVSLLRNKVIHHLSLKHIKKLVILNLGDLISGRIHALIRLLNRIDAISLIIEASEILAEFMHDISEYAKIEYYACLDNHSRVEPNKKESLLLESFARITTWYLDTRFANDSNIKIYTKTISPDMITFEANGWKIAGVHGDLDKPNKVVSNISLMTRTSYDLICTAHLHHFNADEQNRCMVVSNPSLMGTDQYALDLRFCSYPALTFIVCSDYSPVEEIDRIILV